MNASKHNTIIAKSFKHEHNIHPIPGTMDFLPVELVTETLSYITDRKDRISAACVSRTFKEIIERTTFQSIKITNLDLPTFKSCFRDAEAHRREALRELRYKLSLADHGHITSHTDLDYDTKTQKINEAFTEAVSGLLRELSAWDIDSNVSGTGKPHDDNENALSHNYKGLELEITDTSMGQDPTFSYLRLTEAAFMTDISKDNELEEDRGQNVATQACLPQIPRITKFTVFMNRKSAQQIESATIAQLSASMPNLYSWQIVCGDLCTEYPVVKRQQIRLDFGQTLLKLYHEGAFQNLKEIYLLLTKPTQDDFQTPALQPHHDKPDILSVALHTLSRLPLLKRFSIFHFELGHPESLSSELFWPKDLIDDNAGPTWPSLETLQVTFSPRTPSGGSYTKKRDTPSHLPLSSSNNLGCAPDPAFPRDSDHITCITHGRGTEHPELKDLNRTILDPESFTPVVTSLAKAIRNMEKLSLLYFHLVYCPSGVIDSAYSPEDYEKIQEKDEFFTCEYLKGPHNEDCRLWSKADEVENPQNIGRSRWLFRVRKHAMWNVLDESDPSGQEVRGLLRDVVGPQGVLKVQEIGPITPPFCSVLPPWIPGYRSGQHPEVKYIYL